MKFLKLFVFLKLALEIKFRDTLFHAAILNCHSKTQQSFKSNSCSKRYRCEFSINFSSSNFSICQVKQTVKL